MPLLRGETASYQGEQYNVQGLTLDVPGVTDLPVVVAALGPAMIKLTAELADGTNTWWWGRRQWKSTLFQAFTPQVGKIPQLLPVCPSC